MVRLRLQAVLATFSAHMRSARPVPVTVTGFAGLFGIPEWT